MKETKQPLTFQTGAELWALACFGHAAIQDKMERSHRFIEEALELVQVIGMPAADAHKLVDYVYAKSVGELKQEVGGVMLTLAILCYLHNISMSEAADTELKRVWEKIESIRAKQAAKPKGSPLPT